MKKLKYKKVDCDICDGSGIISVSSGDLVVVIPYIHMDCPLCNGKGYLNILNTKEG